MHFPVAPQFVGVPGCNSITQSAQTYILHCSCLVVMTRSCFLHEGLEITCMQDSDHDTDYAAQDGREECPFPENSVLTRHLSLDCCIARKHFGTFDLLKLGSVWFLEALLHFQHLVFPESTQATAGETGSKTMHAQETCGVETCCSYSPRDFCDGTPRDRRSPESAVGIRILSRQKIPPLFTNDAKLHLHRVCRHLSPLGGAVTSRAAVPRLIYVVEDRRHPTPACLGRI